MRSTSSGVSKPVWRFTMDNPTKICAKCHVELPATIEYFSPEKRGKYGVKAVCKSCRATTQREYCADNLEETRERNRNWRKANPEKHRESHRKWQQKNAEHIREYSQAYYQSRYGCEPALAVKIASHNRRAILRGLPGTLTPTEWLHALAYFDNRCPACGCKFDGTNRVASIDHWIPLSAADSPGTVASNIIPLCHTLKNGCNTKKRNKRPEVWLAGLLSKAQAAEVIARIEAYFASLGGAE